MTIPRDVGQMLVEKLDRRLVSVAEAKLHCGAYGLKITGQTRAQVAREICRSMTRQEDSAK